MGLGLILNEPAMEPLANFLIYKKMRVTEMTNINLHTQNLTIKY